MDNQNREIVEREAMSAPLTAANIRGQVNLIQEVMREVMQGPSKDNPNGVHYGLIPGCGDKPTLLKPGAEKLFLTFRLRPIIDPINDIIITEMANGHRDYRVHCHILNMNGVEMATGVGSASTMESKHRYRGGEKKTTGKPVPKEYWNLKKEGKDKDAQATIGGTGFGPGKIDGAWMICEKGEKMENPDIADQYNTVLKMAAKRAKVDGCLSATACSDIFTQDIEDFVDVSVAKPATDTTAEPAKPHTPPQRKSETMPPTDGIKTATGFIIDQKAPNKGGFVAYSIEGYVNENGKPTQFSTKDTMIIETLDEHRAKGERVAVEYTENANPAFANSITGLIHVKEEIGDAQEV